MTEPNGAAPENEPETPLRNVAVRHEEKKRPKGEAPTPASAFVIASLDRTRKSTAFWRWGFFLTNLGWLGLLLATGVYFVGQLSAQKWVAIIDPNHTVYLAPLQNAKTSRDLLDEDAALMALSYLQRNPNGLDLKYLFEGMFGVKAAQKAKAEIDAWKKQAAAANLRWKAEITGNEPLNPIESGVVLDRVTGRVMQSAPSTAWRNASGFGLSCPSNWSATPN